MKIRLPLLTVALATASAISANAALIHHWTFDETSGGTAADSAGANNAVWNDGVSNNLTWTAGQVGNAANLNNVANAGQYFNAGVLNLAGSNAISISGWYNRDTGTGYAGVLTTRSETNSGSWALASEADHVDFHTSGTGNQIDSGGGILLDTWVHFVAVWDNNTGNRAVYINGDPAGTGASTSNTFLSATAFTGDGSWRIGNDDCCGDRDFDGMIDDLAVFDHALTAADAAAIFAGAGNGLNVAQSIPEPSAGILALLAGLVAFRRRR